MFPDKYTRNVTYLQAGWGSNGTVKHLYLKIFLFTHKTSSMTNDSWNLENLQSENTKYFTNILPLSFIYKIPWKMFPDKYTRNVTYLQAGWGSNGTVKHLYLKIFLFTHKTSSMTNDSWNLENLQSENTKYFTNILPLSFIYKIPWKMFPDKYTRNVTYLQAGWGSNGTVKHLYLKIFLFTHKTSSMTNDSWNLENLHLKIQNILPIFYHSASSTKFREKCFQINTQET